MKDFYTLFLLITGAKIFDLIIRGIDYADKGNLGAIEIAGPSAQLWGITGIIIAGVIALGIWKNTRLASWGCVTASAYFATLAVISLINNWGIFPEEIRVSGSFFAMSCVWFVCGVFWNSYAAVQTDRANRG